MPAKSPARTTSASRPGPDDRLQTPTSIDSVALWLERRNLEGAALIALTVARPLTWIGGQLLWTVQPFLSSIFPEGRGRGEPGLATWARILEDERQVEALRSRLEKPVTVTRR